MSKGIVEGLATSPPSVPRRAFVAGLSLLPVALALACSEDEDAQIASGEPDGEAPAGLSDSERNRFRSLADGYVQAQATHDLDAAMAFFGEKSKMSINGRVFDGVDAIRTYLVEQGVAGDGGLDDARVEAEAWFFTDDAILVEGRIYGKHVGDVAGFPATEQDAEIAFASFYRFDDEGHFTTCETVMNWFLLVPTDLA